MEEKEEKKVPEIRFKGFSDDWEKRKLENIINVNNGKDYKKLKNGDIPVYGTGGYMLSVNKYLSDKDAIGIGRKGTIDSPFILKAPFWTVDTLFYCIPIDGNLYFIFEIFQNINWHSIDESSGLPSLSKTNINKISVYLPNNLEQEKIGQLFKKIDDCIEVSKRKLDKLKLLKKALLQQLFPQKNEVNPRIRFFDYYNNWEQRMLNDCLYERNEKIRQSINYPLVSFTVEEGVTPKTKRYDRSQLVSGDNKNKLYKLTKRNDIVYNPANLKFGAIGRNKYGNAVFSPIYITFEVNENLDVNFIEGLITRNDFIKYSLKFQQGTVFERQSVSSSDFLSIKVKIPVLNEQKRIGKILYYFDKLISIQERKLKNLNILKKSLLQNMFI